jgi:hypothetical protein
MKRTIAIILLTISFVSCNAQDAEIQDLKGKLNSALSQVDSIKLKYDVKLGQYSDTIAQMQGQIEAYELMLQDCPDTNLVNDLFRQKAALEIQIANMKIVEDKSYNLMLRFNELWQEWSEIYPVQIKE